MVHLSLQRSPFVLLAVAIAVSSSSFMTRAARADDDVTDAGAATAAEPTQQELLEELRALRAKVEQLQAKQEKQENRLTAAEVDSTVDEVIRDADRRSQLLQAQGFTAGYDKGKFLIQSENGDFVLNPQLQMQLRYIINYREEDAGNVIDGDSTTENGIELRRMKLNFEGNVFGPDNKYKFQWATNRNSGNLVLEEAYIRHKLKFAPDFQIRAGQFKDVTFHEELLSSKRQLAVDRSMANQVLAGNQTKYIQGIGLIWDDGDEGLPLRAEIGYTDGPNSSNTNFVDGAGAPTYGIVAPDYGIYGRAEYLAFGDWKHYEDFSAMGNKQDTLVFGGGFFYTQNGDQHLILHTIDAQYEYNKLGLYAAYYGAYSDGTSGDEGSAYDSGGVVQAGYMLNRKWEIFGRYSLVALDTPVSGSTDDTYHEFTAGVNYYMVGHAAKLTFDVIYLPSGVPNDQNGIGELDPDADEEQFVLRGQFQLLL